MRTTGPFQKIGEGACPHFERGGNRMASSQKNPMSTQQFGFGSDES